MTSMNAIILAAGRGSRLGDLTDGRPKGLVNLLGHPLIGWQVAGLRAGGVARTAIVRGYRGEMMEGYADHLFENPRWSETNMVMSLAAAAPWLRQGPCIISYSDIFYPAELVRSLCEVHAPLAISYDLGWWDLWTARFGDPLSDAETFRLGEAGRVTDIGRKPTARTEVEGQYMGLLRIEPEGWSWIEALLAELGPDADRLDMTGMLGRLIAAGHPVVGVPFSGVWGEVDSPTDLALYRDDPKVAAMGAALGLAGYTDEPSN